MYFWICVNRLNLFLFVSRECFFFLLSSFGNWRNWSSGQLRYPLKFMDLLLIGFGSLQSTCFSFPKLLLLCKTPFKSLESHWRGNSPGENWCLDFSHGQNRHLYYHQYYCSNNLSFPERTWKCCPHETQLLFW